MRTRSLVVRLIRLGIALGLTAGLTVLLAVGMSPSGLAKSIVGSQALHTENQDRIGWVLLGQDVLLALPGVHVDPPRIGPDGRTAAIAAVPTGAQTDGLAHIYVVDTADGAILATLPGHTPRWEVQSGRLAFFRAGPSGYGLFDPRTGQIAHLDTAPPVLTPLLLPESSAPDRPVSAGQIITYPATIRVIHHGANTCRDVPTGQIDVIPFEEYVARVVPNEVPALWPFNAVAAQSVSARTYAWYQILQGRTDYDVSDWANFQMMCDIRHSASDAAVSATTGIYLSAQSDPDRWPILAMYSAENGHPTLTNPNVTYLQAVPDTFALGTVRNGHGYGLSQWGAYRRASAGHHYLQILGHYYTGVHAQNGLDTTSAVAALLDPPPPTLPDTTGYLAPGGLYWRALTPASPISPSLTVTASAGLTTVLAFSQTAGIWRSGVPLAEGTVISAQFWLSATGGITETDRRVLIVDRTPPPTPTITAPVTITQRTIPVTVTGAEPVARVGLSGGWLWQGEALSHTAQSGAVVSDSGALNGLAWQAQTGVDQPGAWYGPYTDDLPPAQGYRALFRLRAGTSPTSSVAGLFADTIIARLDVTDEMGEVRLGLRDLRAADFTAGGEYTEIGVDFYLFDWAKGLEFRVDWRGNTDLALDHVQIWTLPTTAWQNGPLDFLLPAQEGDHVIQALAFDGADNPSAPGSLTVNAVDVAGPIFGSDFTPTGWQTAFPVDLSLDLADALSGLDPAGGLLQVTGPSSFFPISATLSLPDRPNLAQRMGASVTALADGRYTATFQAADRAEHTTTSEGFPLWIDLTQPSVTGTITATVAGAPLSTTNGWHLAPVRAILAGTDETSGLEAIHYDLGSGPRPYVEPVVFNTAGVFGLTFGAVDVAGNPSENQFVPVKMDLAAPTATLRLDQSNPLLVVARWSGGDDAAGVDRFQVESRVGTGAWTPLTFTPASGEQVFVVETDTILYVRVRAVDGAQRVGEWSSASAVGTARKLFVPGIMR